MELIKPTDLAYLFGSVTKAAAVIGVSRQTIHNWVKDGSIPAVYQPLIRERLVNGADDDE